MPMDRPCGRTVSQQPQRPVDKHASAFYDVLALVPSLVCCFVCLL